MPLQAKTVLILGDSLSAGYGLSQSLSWVHLVQTKLTEQQVDMQLINASISGETTAGALARLPVLLQQHQPDYVLIELGANDGLRGFPLPGIKQNLKQLIDLATQSKARPVLMQIRIPPNYGPRYTSGFEAIYTQLSAEHTILLWPFFMEKIATQSEFMQKDGLHPNEQGQLAIVDLMLPKFEKLD